MNHRSVKVLKVGKGEYRGVLYQLERQRHAGRRQGHRAGELQTLVLDERTLCAQPADADGVEFAVARGRNLLRLDGDSGFGHVVNLGNTGPSVSGEVSNGPVLVAVVVIVVADVAGKSTLRVSRVALDVDEGTFGTDDVAGVS